MKFKHIHFIINPGASKEEPILSYINQAFADTDIRWGVSVTRKKVSAGDFIPALIGKTDLVAVYGGDGCVTEVAAALHGSKLPLAIIPGGTANVMAKELGVPTDTLAALEILKKGKYTIKKVDMGTVNKRPFLLRVNLGIMADMIINADTDVKKRIGQLAYGITAIETLANSESVDYTLNIDGKKIKASGVSLTVTNSGNMGIGDFALQPGISITDGLLDIILLKDNNFMSLLKAAGSSLLQTETDAVQHWKCRQVVIGMAAKQAIIGDDTVFYAKKLNIKVIPGSIRMLVPHKSK